MRRENIAVPPDWPGYPAQRRAEMLGLESNGVASSWSPRDTMMRGLERVARALI